MAVILFSDKQNCCGCGACVNACPQGAISMREDEDGFCYPQVDADKCVECGLCLKACGYQKPPAAEPTSCYAAAAKQADTLKKSASGGVFAVLAQDTLANGGVVYGAATVSRDGGLVVRHLRVDKVDELSALQGSKYVQSEIGTTYTQAAQDLQQGRRVLFSGTPCQIAGLRAFLGREYRTLLTVEVICHGVPSAKLFSAFLAQLGEAGGLRITDFVFRTKEKGQGMNVGVSGVDRAGRVKRKVRNGHLFSYMHYFLASHTYRENCYSCPFATKARTADITIGDFWGFHEEYPTVPGGVALSNAKGVSCVLINSETGRQRFDSCREQLEVLETQFDTIARHNQQLRTPSRRSQERERLLALFREEGYPAVERRYRKTCRKARLANYMASLVPKGVKRTLKRLLGIVR